MQFINIIYESINGVWDAPVIIMKYYRKLKKNHLEEERPLYKYLFRLFLFIYFDDCHNIFVLSLVYPEYVALLRVKNKV